MGRLLFWLFFLFPALLGAQTTTDPQEAFRQAALTGKPVLLVFQGSDWCIPCIRLEQQVLSTEQFNAFARDRFLILKADFPQKKKIPATLVQQYEALAEIFNPEGRFPKLLLLGKDKQALHTFQQDYSAPGALIDELEKTLKEAHAAM